MGRPAGWATRATGRAPMWSPGRPPVARREHRQQFWLAIAGSTANMSPAPEPQVSDQFRAAGNLLDRNDDPLDEAGGAPPYLDQMRDRGPDPVLHLRFPVVELPGFGVELSRRVLPIDKPELAARAKLQRPVPHEFRRWSGAGSNRRHHDFQSCALPT